MKIETKKSATIYLDGPEVEVLKILFGNMSFSTYLNIIGDKNLAEDAQLLGGLIYDTLRGEGF